MAAALSQPQKVNVLFESHICEERRTTAIGGSNNPFP